MALLERVEQLRSQGMQDPQVIQALQGEGANPQQINEALGQAQVKTEVAGVNSQMNPTEPSAASVNPPQPPISMDPIQPATAEVPGMEGMQPSSMTAPVAPPLSSEQSGSLPPATPSTELPPALPPQAEASAFPQPTPPTQPPASITPQPGVAPSSFILEMASPYSPIFFMIAV